MKDADGFMFWFAVAYPRNYVSYVRAFLAFKKDMENLINEEMEE